MFSSNHSNSPFDYPPVLAAIRIVLPSVLHTLRPLYPWDITSRKIWSLYTLISLWKGRGKIILLLLNTLQPLLLSKTQTYSVGSLHMAQHIDESSKENERKKVSIKSPATATEIVRLLQKLSTSLFIRIIGAWVFTYWILLLIREGPS